MGVLEFECVELVMSYMYLADNINPYGANGNQVVSAYTGSTLLQESSNNNAINANLSPGDILSWNNSSTDGHTSLVSAVNIDGSGNGTITTIEQNASANGTFTYPVSDWVLNTEGYCWRNQKPIYLSSFFDQPDKGSLPCFGSYVLSVPSRNAAEIESSGSEDLLHMDFGHAAIPCLP
jgi:hypothetical protein